MATVASWSRRHWMVAGVAAVAGGLCLVAFVVGVVGANFVVKIQGVILVILIVSVAAMAVSPLLAPRGLFRSTPNWSGNLGLLGFWAAFAAFFPAVTGITGN